MLFCEVLLPLNFVLSWVEGEDVLTKKEEEERRIAELGRPMLGEHVKLEVIVEESYEFKVGSAFVFLGHSRCQSTS